MTDAATLEERAGSRSRRSLSFDRLAATWRAALEHEAEHRRFSLWVPVATGAGIVLYFSADREPNVWLTTILAAVLAGLAALARAHRRSFMALVTAAAVLTGMAAAGWRTARVAAPVLARLRIATVQGWIEEMEVRDGAMDFLYGEAFT